MFDVEVRAPPRLMCNIGANACSILQCIGPATDSLRSIFGRSRDVRRGHISIALYLPAAMEIISEPDRRDRVAFAVGGGDHRRFHRRGFFRSNVFSISQDRNGLGYWGGGFSRAVARAGTCVDRVDGNRPGRRSDVGRDRHHESNGTNRRFTRACSLSHRLSGRAARSGDDGSMPLLVAECIAVGIAVGYFVAIFLLEINGTYYMANMVRWTRSRDIIMGISKAFCFGILIVFISCHKGLTAREGAVGVGRATTEAVVNASLAVLISNFFLTMTLNIVYPAGYQ